MGKQNIIENAESIIRDDANYITPQDKEEIFQDAIVEHSTYFPHELVEQVAADGTRYLPLPGSYVEDISEILRLEIEDTEVAKTDWREKLTKDGKKIHLDFSPQSTVVVDVKLSTLHNAESTVNTLTIKQERAMGTLVAAGMANRLANLFGQSIETTEFEADIVDFGEKPRTYSDLRDELKKDYKLKMGLQDSTDFSDEDIEMGYIETQEWPSGHRMFHGSEGRD